MILLKTTQQIKKIAKAGSIVADVLLAVKREVKEGVKLSYLDKLAYRLIKGRGGEPAFLGYNGFPATLCTSINDEVIHGIPDGRRLQSGDLLKVDVGVRVGGWHADGAITIIVDDIFLDESRQLVRVTKEALYLAIAQAQPGNLLFDISFTIQHHAKSFNYHVIEKFGGHGIGENLHEEPSVPNIGEYAKNIKLCPGMVLCIEPMLTTGSGKIYISKNNWTVKTEPNALAAHFEHTIVITEDGPQILTPWDDEMG